MKRFVLALTNVAVLCWVLASLAPPRHGPHGSRRDDSMDKTGVAFSAYARVIAGVASAAVRARRINRMDARHLNADRAVNVMSCGGNARIGVVCEMLRVHMALASRSGSSKDGYSDR